MNSFHEFIFMGKHGAYVWSSYLMTFIVLLGVFYWFRYLLKSLRSQVKSELNSSDSNAARPKARKLKVEKNESRD
ncbi:heme exporter protein CcmD [Kangiella koreensis]|uniref:Heme exporter protein D n=1 Tax=Kangiella koreensis (strain DSM 16069 / JCM 12317 / KCTC 12182 / SW-125) TaxID=523791 RepID=C7RAV9_KANKD|nr:heme exporter protein CcmD [Kangiella koreensis]ACV26401.1 heme exporter protein CcmD [Kangiella koreensis DSM 16069]